MNKEELNIQEHKETEVVENVSVNENDELPLFTILGIIWIILFAFSQFLPALDIDGATTTNFSTIIFMGAAACAFVIASKNKKLIFINLLFII